VPGLNDSVEHLESYGKELGKYKCVERLEILPYHTLGVYKYKKLGWDYKLKGVEPPTEKELQKAKIILEKYFKKVIVR
jgi:pyruvate formate lyase activating enzyme